MRNGQVSLLLSGGIDSTAVLAYYLENGFDVRSYFIHYGHSANDIEYKHAQMVSEHYNTPLTLLSFVGVTYNGKWEIAGRNAFLILSVLMASQSYSGIISAGIHKGSSYYDCNQKFIYTMKEIISGYSEGAVQLDFPFFELTKDEIMIYSKLHKVPTESTYSCQIGMDKPCGKCPSCVERNEAIMYIDNKVKVDK
jgi:7-cyano-7-deazaguanine synthase